MDFGNRIGRTLGALISIYALRMLGLFMIFPVLGIYAHQLRGETPFLIGVAYGAYGLTQAIFQIPFGILSDKFGRKRLIAIGLIIFAVGSVVAALSDSIYGLIIGRFIQGMGAVSAVVAALVADLIPPQQRAKAMAVIGLSIGVMFSASLILSPYLAGKLGFASLFWIIAALSLAAIAVLYAVVPDPQQRISYAEQVEPIKLKAMWLNPQLIRLNIGIFVLHTLLTASFVVVPMELFALGAVTSREHWAIYLLAIFMSYMLMAPLLWWAEKQGRQVVAFVVAFAGLFCAEIWLGVAGQALIPLAGGLLLFLAAFNLLEALLPAWVSRVAPAQAKGAALGIFATAQFLGIATGGYLAGTILNFFPAQYVFFACSGLVVIALCAANGLKSLTNKGA